MKLQNIAPITELKRDAAKLIERAAEEHTPIVITQNGRATAVLVDVQSYEEDRRAFALLELALQGEREIRHGRGLTLEQHGKRVRRRLDERKPR